MSNRIVFCMECDHVFTYEDFHSPLLAFVNHKRFEHKGINVDNDEDYFSRKCPWCNEQMHEFTSEREFVFLDQLILKHLSQCVPYLASIIRS